MQHQVAAQKDVSMTALQQQGFAGMSPAAAMPQSYDEAVAAAERVLQAAKIAVKAKEDAAADADAPQHVMHG
jgi:hypothetical protein